MGHDHSDAPAGGPLWAGGFVGAPDPRMWAFTTSLAVDRRLWRQDVAGSRAHVRALVRAGVLGEEEGQRLLDGLAKVAAELAGDSFEWAAGDEDVHTAVERRLTELVGPLGGKLHTGRSRNDQVATDLHLWLKEACADAVGAVAGLVDALVAAPTSARSAPARSPAPRSRSTPPRQRPTSASPPPSATPWTPPPPATPSPSCSRPPPSPWWTPPAWPRTSPSGPAAAGCGCPTPGPPGRACCPRSATRTSPSWRGAAPARSRACPSPTPATCRRTRRSRSTRSTPWSPPWPPWPGWSAASNRTAPACAPPPRRARPPPSTWPRHWCARACPSARPMPPSPPPCERPPSGAPAWPAYPPTSSPRSTRSSPPPPERSSRSTAAWPPRSPPARPSRRAWPSSSPYSRSPPPPPAPGPSSSAPASTSADAELRCGHATRTIDNPTGCRADSGHLGCPVSAASCRTAVPTAPGR